VVHQVMAGQLNVSGWFCKCPQSTARSGAAA
jgi:hypothetical protein